MNKSLAICICLLATSLYGQGVYKVKPEQMTGRKAQGVYGDVKKVSSPDGNLLEFDKDGNLLKKKSGETTLEYTYESPTRYILYNDYYNVIYTDSMRIEKWDDAHEDLSTDYTFDAQGRIIGYSKVGYGEWDQIRYYYQNEEFLPYKIVESGGWEAGSYQVTSLYTYTAVDTNENWTSCNIESKIEEVGEEGAPVTRTERRSKTRSITYFSQPELSTSQTYAPKNEKVVTGTTTNVEKEKDSTWTDNLSKNMGQIIVIFILLCVVAHMLYVKFVFGKRYRIVYTPEYFQEIRRSKGLNENTSEEEDKEIWSLLSRAFEGWPVVEQTDDEYRKPKRMKHIKSAAALIDQAIELAPTNQETVNCLNELTEVINSNETRVFDGSKALIGIATAVSLFLWYSAGFGTFAMFFVATLTYILASQTPVFLVEKRSKRGGGNIHDGIFKGTKSMVKGAKTVRTTTTWSDGSKTVEDDHSEHWISLFFSVIILFMQGILIAIWTLVNYLRNYILYI